MLQKFRGGIPNIKRMVECRGANVVMASKTEAPARRLLIPGVDLAADQREQHSRCLVDEIIIPHHGDVGDDAPEIIDRVSIGFHTKIFYARRFSFRPRFFFAIHTRPFLRQGSGATFAKTGYFHDDCK